VKTIVLAVAPIATEVGDAVNVPAPSAARTLSDGLEEMFVSVPVALEASFTTQLTLDPVAD
jgi:hypothetical protein